MDERLAKIEGWDARAFLNPSSLNPLTAYCLFFPARVFKASSNAVFDIYCFMGAFGSVATPVDGVINL